MSQFHNYLICKEIGIIKLINILKSNTFRPNFEVLFRLGGKHMDKRKMSYYLIFFIIIISVIVIWVIKIMNGKLPYMDQWTREFVESIQETKLFAVARLITELGSESFLIPFTVVTGIILWISFRDYLAALIFSGGTLVSHLINMFIKALVARERPRLDIGANAEGYSFPSGHAMISLVCYGLLMYILTKKIKSAKVVLLMQYSFALLIALIGMSRVIINVHYLTDVLTGFMVGFILLFGLINLYEFFIKCRTLNKV